ncbi:MAG TPA: hypothetical protein VF192_13415 [Longimicrobiales bacterium]
MLAASCASGRSAATVPVAADAADPSASRPELEQVLREAQRRNRFLRISGGGREIRGTVVNVTATDVALVGGRISLAAVERVEMQERRVPASVWIGAALGGVPAGVIGFLLGSVDDPDAGGDGGLARGMAGMAIMGGAGAILGGLVGGLLGGPREDDWRLLWSAEP